MSPPLVTLRAVSKTFETGTQALDNLNLEIRPGEFLTLLGPSGCGKSTALRIIAGLMKTSSGDVEWGCAKPELGFVFQEPTLMPWASVEHNVWLPLRLRGQSLAQARARIHEALELVGLSRFAQAYPRELSGGMKKRAALARALALDPPLVFSDEPTAGLDPIMTAVVDELTQRLTQKIGATVVVVTHDMNSVFRIGTRIIMLGTGPNQGRIIASGTPAEIRAHPHPAVQQFINGDPQGDGSDDSGEILYRETLLGINETGMYSRSAIHSSKP